MNNTYNEKEVKNKLKNFKEGKDYSVLQEDKKIKYNFHNNFLRDIMGDNWTTVYEVAENWDSDNYNHHREAGEYVSKNIGTSGQRGKVTYRYEYRINKNADYYAEWSWGEKFEDGSKGDWILRGRPNPNFNNGFFLPGNFENDEEIKHQERLNGSRLRSIERDKKEFEDKLAYYESLPAEERKNKDTLSLKDKINFLKREIEEEKDWINRNNPQQRGRMGRNEKGKFITDNNISREPHWVTCDCGKRFDKAGDHYAATGSFSGVEHFCSSDCAKIKQPYATIQQVGPVKDKYDNPTDLEKENYELKQQLAEVKNQLKEVLGELKKLRNSSTGQNKAELDQQIDYNEKLIRHSEEVPEAEVKEQVKKSQDLLKKANFSDVSAKNNPGSGSLPYVIGGSVLIGVAAIIGYCLLKKNKEKKIA